MSALPIELSELGWNHESFAARLARGIGCYSVFGLEGLPRHGSKVGQAGSELRCRVMVLALYREKHVGCVGTQRWRSHCLSE